MGDCLLVIAVVEVGLGLRLEGIDRGLLRDLLEFLFVPLLDGDGMSSSTGSRQKFFLEGLRLPYLFGDATKTSRRVSAEPLLELRVGPAARIPQSIERSALPSADGPGRG